MSFTEHNVNGLIYDTSDVITAAGSGAVHAFTTRHGGVSPAPYDSLNFADNKGDTSENLLENYRLLGEAVGFDASRAVGCRQIHSDLVRIASEEDAGKGRAITLKKQLQAVPVAPQPVEIDELAPRRRQVPILGNVAAGNPILAQECIEDYLTFDTGGHDDEYFALRVRGESMLGVGILPDDLVVVHRQNLAQNGQIVVALLGDEATVKTLKRKGSEVWLMPANPDYQPIDGRECTILGRVVAVVRQY